MTRRSRNVLLALGLALAALWLAFELAARAQARAFVAMLAPVATLDYAEAGFTWDGGVRLDAPQVRVTRGLWQGALRAREARIHGPGFWWLLLDRARGAITLPALTRIEMVGLAGADGSDDALVSRFLQPGGDVLFESAGCGDPIEAADRQRMGVLEGDRRDRIELRHDAARAALDVAYAGSSPAFAEIRMQIVLSGFATAAWHEPAARAALRVARVEFGYIDSGYLARRTGYCAQQLGIPPAQFIDRHMVAVEEEFARRGIRAAAGVRDLYRGLVSNGGELRLSAIPDAAWMPSRIGTEPRATTLRSLNVTMRHDDDPPVMLQLGFSAVELAPPLTRGAAVPDAAPGEVPVSVAGNIPAQPDLPMAAADAEVSLVPAPAVAAAAQSVSTAAPVPAVVEAIAAIADAPDPAPVAEEQNAQRESAVDPRNPSRELGASAPEPPKDSTLALVWRPGVIDRLQTADAAALDYDVVAASSLGQYRGRRVRLLTTGGKLVEGRINGVGEGRVLLDIRTAGGNAQVPVALSNVREARLVRSAR